MKQSGLTLEYKWTVQLCVWTKQYYLVITSDANSDANSDETDQRLFGSNFKFVCN